MSCLYPLSFSNCFKHLFNPSSQNLRRALYTVGLTSLVAGALFLHPEIFELGVGGYAIGTGLCAVGIILLVNTAVYDVKTEIAVAKNGGISVKNSLPPIQSVEIIDQCLDKKNPPESLSFESLPNLAFDVILDFMEMNDLFNFRRVNQHWLQLSNKAFASAKLCRQYFIPFQNHDLTKTVLNKFEKAQNLTQAFQENSYSIKKNKFHNLKQIIFKNDKAYLAFITTVQVWDSELKGRKSKLSLDLNSVMMMLVGNVLYCYQPPHFIFHELKFFSFDIKNHSTFSSGVTIFLEEFDSDPNEMTFTFSENKAFAGKKDGTIVVWDLKTNLKHGDDHNASSLLKGHKGQINNLVYQNNLLYSTANDEIKIWNVNTSTGLRTIYEKNLNIAFLGKSKFVVNPTYIYGHFYTLLNSTFKIWEQKTGNCVQMLDMPGWIKNYYIHENLLILFKERIRILDLNCGKVIRTIEVQPAQTKFLNLQIFNDKIVALFENYNDETYVFTVDFFSNKVQ